MSVVVALCAGAVQAQQSAAAPVQPMPNELYLSASKGDKVALQRLTALAESGDALAQFHLGEVYDALLTNTGDTFGVPKDAAQAAAWYGKAAEQGNAADAVSSLWIHAIRDDKAALQQLIRLANKGNGQSQFWLSQMYLEGEGVAADPVQSANWLRKAADQGLAEAERFLGGRYEAGLGVPQDTPQALRWYRKAAQQGDSAAQTQLGDWYDIGWGMRKDPAEAAIWYRRAAEQGDRRAQKILAGMYYDGDGVRKDAVQAMAWLKKAADQDDSEAQVNLGSMMNERSVTMLRKDGVYVVPVLINNTITLDFIVDSGAADVSIPADVFTKLIRAGTLTESDFIGTGTYTLADGSTTSSPSFHIRSLKIEGIVLQNVVGSVASAKGSLLLGQSFLGRFKSWSIDNDKHILVLQ